MNSFWRIIAPVFGLMGARLAGAGFGFLSQIVLARTFAPHDVGVVFLTLSIAAFVSLLITCGYHTAALTYLVRFQALGRTTLLWAFLRAARGDMFVAGAVVVAVALATLLVPLPHDMHEAVLYGTVAAVPLAIIRLNNSAANAQKRFSLSYTPEFVARPGLLLFVILAVAIFGVERNAHYILMAIAVIAVAVAVWQATTLGPDNAFSRTIAKPSRNMARFYRSRAFAMLMVTIVAGATADIVVLLGAVFMSTSDLAVLGVSIRIAALMGFISSASQQFVLRDLATAMFKLGKGEVDAILMRTNLAGLWTMLAALVLALFFGGPLLGLFGPEYQAGYWPLMIFLLSQAVRVLGGMNGHLLALGGHQVRSATLCASVVVVLVVLAAILVPLWGLVGMAIATLVAETFWAVGLAVLARRLEGRRGDILGLILHRA